MGQERTTRFRIRLAWWSVAILLIHRHLLLPDLIPANHYPVPRIRVKQLGIVHRLAGLHFTQMHNAAKAAVEDCRICALAVHLIVTVASGRKDIGSLRRRLNLTVPSSKTNSVHVAFICPVTRRPALLHQMSATWSVHQIEVAVIVKLMVVTDSGTNTQRSEISTPISN